MFKHNQSATPTAGRSFTSRLLSGGLAALSLMVLLVASNVQAAGTAADTTISNTASADYTDGLNKPQHSTSNTVETIVAKVGSYTLVSDNTATVAPGTTKSLSHTLTNTGNFADEFTLNLPASTDINITGIAMFADADGNGVADSTTPICTAPCTSGSTGILQPGQSFSFLVAITVSSTAANGGLNPEVVTAKPKNLSTLPTGTYPVGTAATVAKVADGYSTTSQQANTDTLTVANNLPVFSATKDLYSVTNPVTSTTSTTATSGAINSTVVYRINYNNTGNVAGPLYIKDDLSTSANAGFTYVANSLKWSNPGTGIVPLTGTVPGIDYSVSGTSNNVIEATIRSVPANSQGYIEFSVTVNTTALINDPAKTTNIAYYGYNDKCLPADTSCLGTGKTPTTTNPTNPAPFTPTATYNVVANNGTTATFTNGTITGGDGDNTTPAGYDLVDKTSALPGDTITFIDTIWNAGTGSDIFNIEYGKITAGLTAFPAGTVFSLETSGGSPLGDGNSDGILDTGPMAPGTSVTIILKAKLPVNATGSGPFQESITATSTKDPTKTNNVFNQLDALATANLTLVSNQSGQIAPGGTVVYPHNLNNLGNTSCGTSNDLNSNASNFSFVVTNDQAGTNWTYTLYIDNGTVSGQIDAGDTVIGGGTNGAPLYTTVTTFPALAAGAQAHLLVKVQSPAGVADNVQDVITVTATANCTLTGTTLPATTAPVVDTTTVVAGELRLLKTQALGDWSVDHCVAATGSYTNTQQTQKAGQCIWYRIVAQNQGQAPITAVTLRDTTPAYTTYASITNSSTNSLDCSSNNSPTNAPSATTPPTIGSAGDAVCTWATISGNAQVQMDFAVRIAP